jgi:hypothetical protein
VDVVGDGLPSPNKRSSQPIIPLPPPNHRRAGRRHPQADSIRSALGSP